MVAIFSAAAYAAETAKIETTMQSQAEGMKTPGFAGVMAVAILATVYLIMRREK